ncbi:type IV secretory system conjugative DNA transfer family protein [Saccharothrix mutabilis]|uniref:type IV secretory system conjugative DNA transfer family protein n=1 Tax=Saccharothrix mutabilis TaxID=33921 RepID=UPI0036D39FF1
MDLVFPEALETGTAARLFTTLSALFRPVGRVGLGVLPTLVFEVRSTSAGLTHQLTVPAAEAEVVRSRLRGVLPGLALTDLATPPPGQRWNRVLALHRPQEVELAADPRLVRVLLESLVVSEPDQAVLVQAIMTPVGRPAVTPGDPAFAVSLRLAASAPADEAAERLIHLVRTAYRSLHVFELPRIGSRRTLSAEINGQQLPRVGWPDVLTAGTLAVVCLVPVGTPRVRGLRLGAAQQLGPEAAITSVGRHLIDNTTAGERRVLALGMEERKRHLYVVGPSGMGKTTLLERLIVDDITEGFGVAYLDPKGDSVPRILDRIPERRLDDVVLYDPADKAWSVGFNLLQGEPYAVAGQIVRIVDALSPMASAPRAVNLLRAAIAALALGGFALTELSLILDAGPQGRVFRRQLEPLLRPNPVLHRAWLDFEAARDKQDQAAPINHRLGALLMEPRLQASLSQRRAGLDFADILARNQILLVPLNEHELGEEVRPLIGSLLTAKFWQAAQARRGGQHQPFFWYVDEFDDMAAGSYQAMVARARGHDIGLTLAHQQPGRFTPALRADVFSNMSSKVVFQTTSDTHARMLAAELGEPVTAEDVKHLGAWEVLARLAIPGGISRAVSGQTLQADPPVLFSYRQAGHAVVASIGAEARRRALAAYARPMAEALAAYEQLHRAGHAHRPAARPVPAAASPPEPPAEATAPAVGWEDWPE